MVTSYVYLYFIKKTWLRNLHPLTIMIRDIFHHHQDQMNSHQVFINKNDPKVVFNIFFSILYIWTFTSVILFCLITVCFFHSPCLLSFCIWSFFLMCLFFLSVCLFFLGGGGRLRTTFIIECCDFVAEYKTNYKLCWWYPTINRSDLTFSRYNIW